MQRFALTTAIGIAIGTSGLQAQDLAYSIEEFNVSHFGVYVSTVGDVDGDQVPDFAAGTHRFHAEGGRISMYSGVDGHVIWSLSGGSIGVSIATPGDINADGIPDLRVDGIIRSGSDGSILRIAFVNADTSGGMLYFGDVNSDGESDLLVGNEVFSGLDGSLIHTLAFTAAFTSFNHISGAPGDVTGDGIPDILAAGVNGDALLFSGSDGSLLRTDTGNGFSGVKAIDDFNGDGQVDYVVPGFPIRVVTVATGLEIYSGDDGGATQMAAVGDYNGNGTPDFAFVGGLSGFRIFEGSNGSLITQIAGETTWSLAGLGDRNGDGLSDVVVGFPFNLVSDDQGEPLGIQGLLRIYDSNLGAEAYCSAKPNSLGCSPTIELLGSAQISSSTSTNIVAANLLNQKPGLFFYGFAGANLPFLGGTLCVQPPLRRTPIGFSSGSLPPVNDCSGMASFDLKQWVLAGNDPLLTSGTEVFLQHWSRDPGFVSPDNTGLTGGLSLTLDI